MPSRKIEISYKTVLFTLGVLGLVWFIVQISDILLLLFVSVILASAFHSPVNWLVKKKIPRPLAIIFLYLLMAIVLGGIIAIIVPPLIEQTKNLLNNLPDLLNSISQLMPYPLPTQDILMSLGSGFNNLGGNIFRYTLGFFGNIITVATLFVFTFYLLLRWENLGRSLSAGLGSEERFTKLLNRIETGLGNWVRGELFLMATIGITSYIGLSLLGIPYALPLGIFAGLLEIVPIVGPIIAAVPAVIVALSISPILALVTAAFYFLIQQLENNLIVPKVMERAVGLDPLATILSLMVGAKLMGTLGALLAVPFVLLAKIVILDFYRRNRE